MKFTLEIELGNDAMSTWGNIRDALRQLTSKLNTRQYTGNPEIDGGKIMDINGNSVGKWEIAPDYEPKTTASIVAAMVQEHAKATGFTIYERMDQATAHAKPEEYIVAFESIATGCTTYATTLDPASLGERKKPVVIMRRPQIH